jgi:protein CpxP
MQARTLPRFSSPAMRLAAAGLVLAVASTATLVAFAAPHGGHGGHGGHHAMAMGGPTMMKGRMLNRMLDDVMATDAQRAQIRQIVESARSQAQGQREQRRALREQGLRVFTQPNIDANAAEALRAQASKRHLQTMLDIARVLTPEQRAQIAQRIGERRELMQRHQRERRQLDQRR